MSTPHIGAITSNFPLHHPQGKLLFRTTLSGLKLRRPRFSQNFAHLGASLQVIESEPNKPLDWSCIRKQGGDSSSFKECHTS
jgi:hypothetical protein